MFTGHEDHSITLAEAAKMTKKFRDTLMPFLGGIKGGFFGKDAINELLAQDGAVGIRIYLGLSDDTVPLPQFILVAVDTDGNDMTAKVKERGVMCPPVCGITNALNS